MAYTVTTIKANNARDVVTSLDQTRIFVSDVSRGAIEVYDTRSGALIRTFLTEQPIGAMSLSQSGNFLYVAALNAPVIYQISTANGAQIGDPIVGTGNVYSDIEVVDADTLIVSGQGNSAILNLPDRSFSPLSIPESMGRSSILTEDKHLTLFGETGISSAPLYLFDDRTNTIVAQRELGGQFTPQGYNSGIQAISETAGLVFQALGNNQLHLYDLNLTYLRSVNLSAPATGLSVSASGDKLFVLSGSHDGSFDGGPGNLTVYDPQTFAILETFNLGDIPAGGQTLYGDNVVLANAGLSFIVTNPTSGSLQLVVVTPETQNGTDGNDVLVGTSGPDILNGGAGDDSLDGGLGRDVLIGGNGNDRVMGGPGDGNELYGGNGDDIYVVSANDSIYEAVAAGLDRVETNRSNFTLPVNVEQLIYTGAVSFLGIGNDANNLILGGAGDDSLAGGLGADSLVGGAGNDLIDGGTGAANELIGGLGDDTYYVSVEGDTIFENVGEGIDVVRTSLSRYMLGANVENLIFTGSGDFNGVGSGVANLIVGGTGNDILNGGAGNDILASGAGNDVLIGGAGNNELIGGTDNDIYYVSSIGDTVVELASEGIDLVITDATSYSLSANIENLVNNGQSNFRGEGNALDNVIVGGSGNDVLLGYDGNDSLRGGAGNDLIEGGVGDDSIGGGDGNDTLTGGEGADRFVFDTAIGTLAANVDRVTNFATGVDGFQLDRAIFTALTAGALTEGQFRAGAVAMDADDRILYDEATGTIYYDADGNGAGLAIAFATVVPTTQVAYTDFVVI